MARWHLINHPMTSFFTWNKIKASPSMVHCLPFSCPSSCPFLHLLTLHSSHTGLNQRSAMREALRAGRQVGISLSLAQNQVELCFPLSVSSGVIAVVGGNISRSLAINTMSGGASRWQKSKTWRSPSSPQIHQKYIYTWNNSYRTPTERWQKTSDLSKGKKLPTYLGRAKEKRKNRDKRIGTGPAPVGGSCEGGKVSTH